MLRDIEHIGISDSSVGRILKEAGFRVPKARRRAAVHSRREPRAHAGELGQADASKHDWFQEGIDPDTGNPSYHHLYGIMDDATGRVSALWMEKEETTSGYWNLMRLANDSTGLYQSVNLCGSQGNLQGKQCQKDIEGSCSRGLLRHRCGRDPVLPFDERPGY